MNEQTIEELLRKAPGISAPAGLAERLKKDVRLPRVDQDATGIFESKSWLRRWLPALALGVFFIACVVAVGVQMNLIADLKSSNEKLRADVQNLDQLRADNAEYQKLLAQSQDADHMRQDNADLLRLRVEVTQLQVQVQEVARLRAANQTLQAQMQVASRAAANPDFFGDARAQAQNAACMNNLKQIGLAARIWAGDHNDAYPTNFISMKNELNNPIILQCPGDDARSVTSWEDVATGNVSYTLLTPVEETYPSSVLAYCPIHHNYCLADGSVQHLSPEMVEKCIKVVDGRLTFVPPTQ